MVIFRHGTVIWSMCYTYHNKCRSPLTDYAIDVAPL